MQKGSLSTVLATPSYVTYTDFEDNPEYMADDDSQAPVRHILRFGNDLAYRTKARVPYAVRGKIPPVMGRVKPANLVALSRALGIGGIPAAATAAAKAAKE